MDNLADFSLVVNQDVTNTICHLLLLNNDVLNSHGEPIQYQPVIHKFLHTTHKFSTSLGTVILDDNVVQPLTCRSNNTLVKYTTQKLTKFDYQ